jgi:site-specific DNA-methyltransferase (adenine-specific)
LRKLPDESCDVVIIDPPYNIGKDFGNDSDKRELGEYVDWCKSWINESVRTLKPNGTMFIYGFSEILAYLSVEIPIQKRWLIWHYTNKNVASLNFWQRSHEAIICAWKEKPVFNRDDVREPYTEGFLNGAAGKVRKGTLGRFSSSGLETIYKAHDGGALPRDVIKIPVDVFKNLEDKKIPKRNIIAFVRYYIKGEDPKDIARDFNVSSRRIPQLIRDVENKLIPKSSE